MIDEKILILGANGMLGHDLVEAFSGYNIEAWDKQNLDITNKNLVIEKITDLNPEIIINATGYTDVDTAEQKSDLAKKINGEAVGNLAIVAKQINSLLVSYSTEYVFDGLNKNGYNEQSIAVPINAYGVSKVVGEKLLQENCSNYYLIRSSWLYGKNSQVGKPRGINFVDLILQKAKAGEKLKIVDDQFGRPTHTVDLAQATQKLVASKMPFGIYHLVNESNINGVSWHEFAKKILEIKNVEQNIEPITTNQFKQKAKRPKHAVLLNTKFEKLRAWEQALKDYLKN